MSAAKAKDKKWELTGSWAGAYKIAFAVGALGLLGAGAGYATDSRRFAFSWLFAFITCLTIALGMLFFVLVQHLTSAGWSVTVRRTAEFWGNGILVLIPLFLPVLLKMGDLFPWLGHHGHDDHGKGHSAITLVTPAYAQTAEQPTETTPAPHADPPHGPAPSPTVDEPAGTLPGAAKNVPKDAPQPHHAGGHAGGGIEAAQHEAHGIIHQQIIAKKKPYLNQSFFLVRVVIYFAVWILLAVKLFGYSTEQDKSKSPELTLKAQRFAPLGAVLFALTLTFAMFDWVMSLEPTWFSTIFGVVMFATGVISSLSVLILFTLALKRSGPLEGAVTIEHYHDLGKLLFGFLVFWAYVSFSQFMLIWYAALPEETTFFHNRYDVAPWKTISYAIVLFHFVLPFFWLMSRWFKRNLGRLQIGALIVLVMHVVEMYWYVMPNLSIGHPVSFHWMDLMCLLAVGGIYAGFVLFRMTKFPLVPVGDPRLERSLQFQNA